jgi:hypothetical protein
LSSPCCRNSVSPRACQIYEHLLRNSSRYFDRYDVLNSDGRRLLHLITKALLEDAPWLRSLVARVRREPTLANIVRLGEEIYGCPLNQLLASRYDTEPYTIQGLGY